MKIRKANVEDSPGLACLQVESYRTAYAGLLNAEYLAQFSYAEQEEEWSDLLSQPGEDILFVAEAENGEIVGYALGRRTSADFPDAEAELVAVHIRDTFQRQGLGRRLFGAIAQGLKERGCSSLVLWVLEGNPAPGFYKRLGGRLLNESRVFQGIKEVVYAWSPNEDFLEQL